MIELIQSIFMADVKVFMVAQEIVVWQERSYNLSSQKKLSGQISSDTVPLNVLTIWS